MPTEAEIRQQLEGLHLNRASRVLGRREINELPNILFEGEQIEALVYGRYRARHGIVAATDQRLIFIEKGLISLFVESFDYSKIVSVRYETGLLFGAVEIVASGTEGRISGVDKTLIQPLVQTIRRHIPQQKIEAVTPHRYASDDDEYIDKLERLAKLKDQGILTNDELVEQKKRILNEKQAG